MNLKINKSKIKSKSETKDKDVLAILRSLKKENLSKKPLMQIYYEVRHGEGKPTKA